MAQARTGKRVARVARIAARVAAAVGTIGLQVSRKLNRLSDELRKDGPTVVLVGSPWQEPEAKEFTAAELAHLERWAIRMSTSEPADVWTAAPTAARQDDRYRAAQVWAD